MKLFRLTFCLVTFVPGFAVLGALASRQNGAPIWWGLTIGALVGMIFGVGFGVADERNEE
jgi:ABC-type uncharacterized transport system permease subunit